MARRGLRVLLALLLVGLVAAPAQALATVAHPPGLSEQDQRFMRQAAQAGLFEIDKSELALERSDDPDVRAFAERMIADHSAQAEQLAALAGKLGVALPDTVSPEQAGLLENLRGVDDDQFDREFMKVQVAAHHQAIALFTAEAEQGRHPAVREFAANGLPVLSDHLRHALNVQGHLS